LGGSAPQARDFQMLLVHTYQNLVKQKFVLQFKSTEENGWQPELVAPIAAVVLANIIGGVLFAVKEGPFASMRMKIEKYVEDLEEQMLAGKDPEDKARLKDRNLVDRVWWNVEHLALFFERCVHKHVYEYQVEKLATMSMEESAQKSEEAGVRDAANQLKDHTCNALMRMLQEKGGTDGYHKDDTETQLTVDLYTSHYNMKEHTVSMATSDLLYLTNILHTYMEADMRNPDNPPVRTDSADNDRVCKLVKAIFPQEHHAKHGSQSVPWNSGYMLLAQDFGEMHNFTIPTRFLEFKNTGDEEPTFCVTTQAPIPRSLAKEDQKKRSGVRVVKPLRSDRGQEYDVPGIGNKLFPYEELMLLFEDLSGSRQGDKGTPHVPYRIQGSSFAELRQSFEDIQAKLHAEMDGGTAGASYVDELLQRLQNGKAFVNKIRESMEDRDLREYMVRELRKRHEYRAYLTSLGEGVKVITTSQEEYKKNVEETFRRLSRISTVTEACELPEEITGAMQIQQERPIFAEAKKLKLRKVKTNPTPARKVLDDLIRTSGDSGKENTEKLKEMVGFPARTFTKSELEKKGVLVQLNDMIPNNVKKEMKFTFQFESEAYNVKAFVKTTLLREFIISRQDIDLFDKGCKNTIRSYGDDFLWVNCFRLRRLLAFIMAEGGL